MRRIAIINQKGGVGKTTTTAHLGAALGLAGKRVLLVDMDPQAHLSLHFGVEVSEDQSSVYDVLTASLPIREAITVVHDSLHLVPSDIDLAAAEAELISVMGREVILREALDVVDEAYDVLLIDCPPSLGILTINALSACHEVVIPLQAQFFALQGLGKLLDTVRLVQQRINPDIIVKGVALCMHDSSTNLSTEIVDDLTEFLVSSRDLDVPWSRAEIFKTRIRRNVKIAESSSFGQTVFEYEPKSNGAIDYNRLAIDIFDCPCVPGLEGTLPNKVENPQPAAVQEDVIVPRQDEILKPTEAVPGVDDVAPEVTAEVNVDAPIEASIDDPSNIADTNVGGPVAAQQVSPAEPSSATTPLELIVPDKTTEPTDKMVSVELPGQPVIPPSVSSEAVATTV